jgi:hypothetical protein
MRRRRRQTGRANRRRRGNEGTPEGTRTGCQQRRSWLRCGGGHEWGATVTMRRKARRGSVNPNSGTAVTWWHASSVFDEQPETARQLDSPTARQPDNPGYCPAARQARQPDSPKSPRSPTRPRRLTTRPPDKQASKPDNRRWWCCQENAAFKTSLDQLRKQRILWTYSSREFTTRELQLSFKTPSMYMTNNWHMQYD